MFLTINKKAATEADAEDILAQSFALEKPFGIPTIILEQKKFLQGMAARQFFKAAVSDKPVWPRQWGSMPYGPRGKNLRNVYNEILKKSDLVDPAVAIALYNMYTTYTFDREDRARTLTPGAYEEYSFVSQVEQKDGTMGYAHNYKSGDYIDPNLNVVISSSSFENPRKHISDFLLFPEDTLPDEPGWNAQWHFFGLWHEFGHGTGAAEPQAETIAAVVYRKAFSEVSVLKAQADIRSVVSMLQYSAKQPASPYYAMDEAIDDVLAMDQSVINAMTEDDIKALRFKKFERHDAALIFVGTTLEMECRDVFKGSELFGLISVTDHLIKRDKFPKGTQEGQIIRRFLQACQRLDSGIPAYRKSPDFKLIP